MAGGISLTLVPDKAYKSKNTFYAWFVVLLAGCGGLLLGYDNGVIGGVVSMSDFQAKFFPDVYLNEQVLKTGTRDPYCKYNNHVLQLIVSSLYIPAAFVSIFAASFARKTGRKLPLFLAGVMFIAGAIIMAAAGTVALLVVGRLVLGIGVGLSALVVPQYNSEMAPNRLRGAQTGLFQLFVTIGILVAGLINYGADFIHTWGWRLPLALAGVPGLLMLIGGIILPDSPASLVERGHLVKARKVLTRVRGIEDVDEEFTDLIEACRLSNMVKHPWRNLFAPAYRPQLCIAIVTMLFQQFTGINAVIFFSPLFFSALGNANSVSLENTCIIGAVNVLATLVGLLLVDRVGRRFLLLAGGLQMILANLVLAVVLAREFGKYGVDLPTQDSVGVVVVLCVFIAGFAWSWGPIGWLVPTEIQPLETRAAGASLNTASNMLGTFLIGQVFISMLCTMRWGVFLFFMGMVIIMCTCVLLFLPETRGKDLEATFRAFQHHWFWKRHTGILDVHAEPLPLHIKRLQAEPSSSRDDASEAAQQEGPHAYQSVQLHEAAQSER